MFHLRAEAEAAIQSILGGAQPARLESSTLDFKEDSRSVSDSERILAEAVICFANSAGGVVVQGVSDKARGPAALVGTSLTPEQIQRRIYDLTSPPLAVSVERVPTHPQILMVFVPQGTQVHQDTKGRATRRIQQDCMPMSATDITSLASERSGFDYSAKPSGTSVGAASVEALAVARKMLARFPDQRRALSSASDLDLLRGVGACDRSGEFNIGGRLMFCDPPSATEVTVLYQFRQSPGGEAKSVHRIPSPVILAFARVMELVAARNAANPLTLKNGQQVLIEDFPSIAFREALSNALCHRDLQSLEPVSIDHSPTVLKVVSPGPLMTGITPNNIITTPSRPRNRVLTMIARNLGLAEELGSGVDRMVRAMISAGRKPPAIQEESSRVTVLLVGGAPNVQVPKFIAQLPAHEQEDTDTLLVLYHLCQSRSATGLALAPWLQKSQAEAEAVLRRLASDEVALIEATRNTVKLLSPTYRLRAQALRALGSAVGYNSRTIDDIDRKVIAHLHEYGKLTNSTLKNLFDIDVFKARDIIKDLAARGVIVRISKATRGPSVEWGPGPELPPKRDTRRVA